jgi:hypothetical protein
MVRAMSDNEDQIDAFIEDFSNLFPENIDENTGDMKILEDFFQDKIPKEIKNSELKKDYKVLLENFNDLLKEVKKETNNLRKEDLDTEKLTEQLSKLKVKYFGKKIEILTKLNKLMDDILSNKEDFSKEDEKQTKKVEKKDELRQEVSDIGEIDEEDISIPEKEQNDSEDKMPEIKIPEKEIGSVEIEEISINQNEKTEAISEIEASKELSNENEPLEIPEIEGGPLKIEDAHPEIKDESTIESPPMEVPVIEGESLEIPEIEGEPLEVPIEDEDESITESPQMEVPDIPEPSQAESPIVIDSEEKINDVTIGTKKTQPLELKPESKLKDKEIEKEIEISKEKEELKQELVPEYQPKPFLSEGSPQEIINSAIQGNKSIPENVKSNYIDDEKLEEDFDSLYNKAINMIKSDKYKEAINILNKCLNESILSAEDRRRNTIMEKIRDVNKQLGKIKYEEATKLYKNNDFKGAVRLWEESINYFNEADLEGKASSVQKTMDKIKKRYNIVIEEKSTIIVESTEESKEEDNNTQFCPECKNRLEYINQYDRFYCRNCKKYVKTK